MFEKVDVFIFTLGHTETWRSRHDGAVFPLAPGVVAGAMKGEDYEFINLTKSDVLADLEEFMYEFTKINPTAKVVVTVSPVPLAATYEKSHVLVATTYSKAVLRVAAEEFSA